MAQTIQIRRGTGSAVPSSLAAGELAINLDSGKLFYGNGSAVSSDFLVDSITAENYTVSSSVTSYTFQSFSGSTDFGDDSGDIHNRTGSFNISGALNVVGNIAGTLSTAAQTNITSVGTLGSLTVSGDITASGIITANSSLISIGDKASSGNATLLDVNDSTGKILLAALNGTDKTISLSSKNLVIDDENSTNTQRTLIKGSVTASGDISSSGNLIANGATFAGSVDVAGNIEANSSGTTLKGNIFLGTKDGSDAVYIARYQGTSTSYPYAHIFAGHSDYNEKVGFKISVRNNAGSLADGIIIDGNTREVTFANVVNCTALNTGQGDNELYAMNQDVETSDNVQFNQITTTGDISMSGGDLYVADDIFMKSPNPVIFMGATGDEYTIGTANNSFIINAGVTNPASVSHFIVSASGGTANANARVAIGGMPDTTNMLTVYGNISSSGYIYADNFLADNGNHIIGHHVNDGLQIRTQNSDPIVFRTNGLNNRLVINDGGSNFSGNITASGNISASGIIFTDTLSSPTNNLTLNSDIVTVAAGTDGDATLVISADTDNNDENDNARLWFKQDGDITEGAIQMSSNVLNIINNVSGVGGISFKTGTTNNTGTTDPATGATERMSISSAGTVTVVGNLDLDGNVIGDGATDISGIDTITTSGNISSSGGSIYGERVYINNKRALNESNNVADLFDGLGLGARINLGKSNVAVSVFTHGAITASGNISSSGDIIGNRLIETSRTRIKILPRDFVADDVGRPMQIEDDHLTSADEAFLFSFGSANAYATVEIPTGYTATHAKISGSDTGQAYKVYEGNIGSKDMTSLSPGTAINTEANITDVAATDSNYLFIQVTSDGSDDEIFGGYVTITPS